MSRHGDYASRRLDQAQPRTLLGKAAVVVAKGVRAADRAATGDSHNRTGGDPTLCHMRARRKGKECGKRLARGQETCGDRTCQIEYLSAVSQEEYNEYMHDTRRQVRRW